MGQISVSDHLHNQLKELKQSEEHKSLDSVIRVLLERAKQVDSTDDHLTAMDDSQYGTIEVTAGYHYTGAEIDALLPPQNIDRQEACEYLTRIWVDVPETQHDSFTPIQFEEYWNDHSLTIHEIMLAIAQEHLSAIQVLTVSSENIADSLQDMFSDSTIDKEVVVEHIEKLTDAWEIEPTQAACILEKHYLSEGPPSRNERTLEVNLDEVIALITEVAESDNPRATARELLTANSENKYSWGTIWFLAPLSPDVNRIVSDSGEINVGKSTGMAWTCNECRVEGHHTTIDAVRINQFSEISQVQCGSCGEWSNYSLHHRFPVSDNSEVRIEWESEQPM